MATSGGHLLVPKALRLIRFAVEKTVRSLRDKLPQATQVAEVEVQPVLARAHGRQPLHKVAAIRQGQNQAATRWYSTKQAINNAVRHYSSGPQGPVRPNRASLPSSRTGRAVNQLTSRAPFASTLRPNLTGGTLCRSAGGYGTGAGRIGGARYFSHSPAAPAQVVNNVSQAVRAFWLSGQKARFDGFNPRTGDKRFRAVSELQERAINKMQLHNSSRAAANKPGSYLDFKVNPTITAIGPLSQIASASGTNAPTTLNCDGLMDVLAVDFARALKDLAAIMNDLKRLAALGDLPISLPNSTTLRVRFPGCDSDHVEALCRELGIRRGMVYQDADFDAYAGTQMALLFPFAPSAPASEATSVSPDRSDRHRAKRARRDEIAWQEMLFTPEAPTNADAAKFSRSHNSSSFRLFEDLGPPAPPGPDLRDNPWLSSPSGYSSLHPSDYEYDGYPRHTDNDNHHARTTSSTTRPGAALFFQPLPVRTETLPPPTSEYDGIEGIYRFIEECDRARR